MGKNRPYPHRKAQKEVKNVEAYQCMVCGVVTRKAHGHHLIPYSEGGAPHLQNMITFCPDCHRKYHTALFK
ncbi:MAG: HNH endonuclease [Spirulina sp. SIO3F2]|nr:HNH endonuclease [Spirulina sp. SIO3F2]